MVLDLLISSSLIAAFIAGIAALFAPCCITVLLPAYLGSIFRQRRTVFLMTFIFFLGLLAVFLPLGLGIAGLGQLFSQYHDLIFIAGGIFLLSLSISILLGRHFSLPFSTHSNLKVSGAGSVFGLGVFSGFATLCCAPVLAGVLALSILPGSIFWGGIYSIAYVLGMVVPLFFLAYFLDRKDIANKMSLFKRKVSYKLAGKDINITMAEALSGITFFAMGTLILYLASTNQLAMGGSDYQTSINIMLANITVFVNNSLGWIPAIVWVVAFIAILAVLVGISVNRFKKNQDVSYSETRK